MVSATVTRGGNKTVQAKFLFACLIQWCFAVAGNGTSAGVLQNNRSLGSLEILVE